MGAIPQTIAQYANQSLKGIGEVFNNGMEVDMMAYQAADIFDIRQDSTFTDIYSSTEGITGTQELSPDGTPPVNALQDGFSVTYNARRFGNGINVNETQLLQAKDNTVKIDNFLEQESKLLMADVKYNMLTGDASPFNLLNNGFVTTVDSAPDSAAFFGAHTFQSGQTFNNSATAKLSSTAVDAMETYGGAYADASGKEYPLDFDTIIVKKGSDNHREAIRLFAQGISPTQVNDINIYEGSKRIVATPYILSANKDNWYARATQLPVANSLRLKVVQMPKLHDPIMEGNLSVSSKITGYWSTQIVNMPFDWYGSTGATN